MALGGFDFLAAEKDTEKKISEIAQVLENVANIFLNGVGALEKQLTEMRARLSKVETQVDTLLRMGGPSAAAAVEAAERATVTPGAPPSPPPSMPSIPATPTAPDMAAAPPQTPTSPMGATGGIGIRAQMQGELRSFLARRRAALEASLQDEE